MDRRNAFYGGGGPMDQAGLAGISAAIKAEIITFPWQKGGVLIRGNLLVSHGREAYGRERKVYAALG